MIHYSLLAQPELDYQWLLTELDLTNGLPMFKGDKAGHQ